MKKDNLKKYKKQGLVSDKIVQKGLMNIYSNNDGSLPDISHLDVRRKNKWMLYLISFTIIALLIGGIYFLGSILLNTNGDRAAESISLDLNGQQNIASGDEVIYVLKYANLEKFSLHDLNFIMIYPDGFSFISSIPAADDGFNTTWTIGELERDAKGKIEIKGKLIGEVGSLQGVNVTASYRPENFSSTFKEIGSFSSQITSSILELSITSEPQILPEKKILYKIKYKNNSDLNLDSIKIVVIYPENFVFQEASPEPYFNATDARKLNNEWIIEGLEKNQEGEIEIVGGYLIQDGLETAQFKTQIGFYDEETEEFSLQQESIFTTEIIQSNLSLDLISNGSTQGQPVNFGQIITYSIAYKNKGQKDLDEVSFTATLDSEVLDWNNLEDVNSGIIDGDTITWGKDQISELDLVRPGDEGTIDFSIRVKIADEVDLDNVTLLINSNVTATMNKVGELEVENLVIKSNTIENTINTDIELQVLGRYFNEDNIAVGTGPLPPVVGQKTSFRIYWSLSNSLHEITNVSVTSILPDGVSWDNKFLVSVGKISFSQSNNVVTWSINRLPPNISFADVNLWFDVSITPTKQQTHKLIILTQQANFSGTDKITDSSVIKIGKAITSNLSDDPIGGGKGLVIDITE